jgi:hypothetical protein
MIGRETTQESPHGLLVAVDEYVERKIRAALYSGKQALVSLGIYCPGHLFFGGVSSSNQI